MFEEMNRKDFHEAIDTTLSGLQADPWLAQRVVNRERKSEPVVKKKLSISLVLVILLLISALTALAVTFLSPKEVVEQIAIPMAIENDGETYTAEQTKTIMEIADQNGIVLAPDTIQQIDTALSKGEGYFKEEMLMALAKTEFGDNPLCWSLNEQNWFDDVCFAIGFVSEKQKTIPNQEENARNLVVDTSIDYIHNRYGQEILPDDYERYSIGVQYLNGQADDEYQGMYWAISFIPHFLNDAEYWVYLNDDAEVFDTWIRPGLSDDMLVNQIVDCYSDPNRFGSYLYWNQQTFRSLQNAILQTNEVASPAYRCMQLVTYPDLPEDGISSEQAIEIAIKHFTDTEFQAEKHAFLVQVNSSTLLEKHSDLSINPVWILLITSKNGDVYTVEVDCITGEIVVARKFNTDYRPWWMITVPKGVVDETGIEYWAADSVG